MSHILSHISRYFTERGIKMAQKDDAFKFLVSEIGEVADALMRLDTESGWVRNDPDKEVSLADEIADVYMMVWILANSYGIDPEIALKNKLTRKRKSLNDN